MTEPEKDIDEESIEVEADFTEELTEEQIAERMASLQAANSDIASLQTLEFIEKWGKVMVTVPMNYLNFEELAIRANRENPDMMGSWHTRVTDKEAVNKMFGYEIGPALVDFVERNRYSILLQQVNLYAELDILHMALDEEGNATYIVNPVKEEEFDESFLILLKKLVKAHDEF